MLNTFTYIFYYLYASLVKNIYIIVNLLEKTDIPITTIILRIF